MRSEEKGQKSHLINGIIIENKAGRQAILAKMLVDATGDAEIAACDGAPFKEVKKPMTMMYNLVRVNIEKAVEYLGTWSNLYPKMPDW